MRTIVLDTTSKQLNAVLGGAVSSDQPEFVVAYADDGVDFVTGSNTGEFNGTTEVTLVDSPATDEERIIRSFSIYNKDTADVTVRLYLDDGTNERDIFNITINAGDTITESGVYDSDGKLKQAFSASATEIATEIDNATEKTTLADDDKFGMLDSAASFVLKWIDWANIKTALNSIYATLSGGNTFTGNQILDNDTSVKVWGMDANPSGADSSLGALEGRWNGTTVISISYRSGDDTVNKDEGEIAIFLRDAGVFNEVGRIKKDGALHFPGISFDGGTNVLSDYEKAGTYTPELEFGGANTGMTYSSRSGKYQRFGNLYIADAEIRLSAKGSSTGSATISLPSTPTQAKFTGNVDPLSNLSGLSNTIFCSSNSTNPSVALAQSTSTDRDTLTESNFTDTSIIRIRFIYW